MPSPNLTILHVASATASAAFYEALLGHPPVEASPGFAMFRLAGGGGLGLWTRGGVRPDSAQGPTGMELCFEVPEVDAAHAEWVARGIKVAMPPTDMEFGRCFVAEDPDGTWLRVFTPGA